MTIDQEKREELLGKLEGLLQMTESNGCTEAEALAASGMAQKLMDKYGLSLSDLKAASPTDACGEDEILFAGRKTSHEVQFTTVAISEFTGTKVWSEHRKDGVHIKFFGLPNDVSIAVWLFKTFQGAMDFEWKRYWSAQGPFHTESPRTIRKSFMIGMARRLNDRMRAELQRARNAANDCRAIVLVKDQLVEAAFELSHSFKLRTQSRRATMRNGAAYAAGQAAGSRVSFNKHLN